MAYRRQRKAATQGMQNLGDGASRRRGPGKECLGQSSALVRRQSRTATAQGRQRLAKKNTSQLHRAGNMMAGSNAHTMSADGPNVWRGTARSMAKVCDCHGATCERNCSEMELPAGVVQCVQEQNEFIKVICHLICTKEKRKKKKEKRKKKKEKRKKKKEKRKKKKEKRKKKKEKRKKKKEKRKKKKEKRKKKKEKKKKKKKEKRKRKKN